MQEYLSLVERVLMDGEQHESRAGPTRRVWGTMLRFYMGAGLFPILTTREIPYRPVIAELAAFLEGTDNVARFEELGCKYWTPNAKAWRSDGVSVGRIYGVQWRKWGPNEYDQLGTMIDNMRDFPESRRHVLTAWNPLDLDDMCLPPCHVLSQYSIDGDRVNCAVYMRSVDLCLGLPSDLILYGALLTIIAKEVGRTPGWLVFHMADSHIYENHVDQAWYQIRRKPGILPTFGLDALSGINNFQPKDFYLVDYEPVGGPLKYPLNV